MKINKRILTLSFTFIVGFLLLFTGMIWRSSILPNIVDDMDDEASSFNLTSSQGEDEILMEGRIGMMSIIWDNIYNGYSLGSGEFPTVEMFETEWKEVRIRGGGKVETNNGDIIFESLQGSLFSENEGSFPIGGVEKRDYEIFNRALNRKVTAEYREEIMVLGNKAYLFSLNITDEKTDGPPDTLSTELNSADKSPLPFEGDMAYLYSDHTNYFLDPRTSIPLDLELDIESSFIFPDTTILQVQEEQVQYSEETIWMPSQTIPGRMVSQDVIKETKTLGRISEEDNMVALYQNKVTYYDRSTGEPLDESVQGGTEEFAVDRVTYRYLTGYLGTGRSGFYQFPVGSIEKRNYPWWDENHQRENTAEFVDETERMNRRVYLYRMISEDVQVEAGNAILPIYYHPGTEYRMDFVQEWYVDAETGLMIDMTINGTVYVLSSGPFGLIEESVGYFDVELPDNTTELLLNVSDLYRDLLIPMSDKPIRAFSMEISFSESLNRDLIGISDEVALYIDLFSNSIPTGLTIIGTAIIAIIVVGLLIYRRVKRNKNL